MLRTTLVRMAAVSPRQPAIKFPDRKKLQQSQQESHEPHPHPAAPKAVADDFAHFQEVFKSGPHFHPEKIGSGETSASGGGSSGGGATAPGVVDDVQQLPPRFWKTPTLLLEEEEMDAIMSGGASLLRR